MARTKRKIVLTLVTAGALAIPLVAMAATTGYKGEVKGDGNSKLTFKVIKNGNKERVDLPKVKNLDATCDSGDQEVDVTFGSVDNAKVNGQGEFSFDNSGGDYVATFEGKLKGKNGSGTLQFSGPTTFNDPSPHTEQCDSGVVDWSAKKS